MNGRLNASSDAILSCDQEDTIHWLQPRSALQHPTDNAANRDTFRQLSASLGLGALLTLGTASAAVAPAVAQTLGTIDLPAQSELSVEVTLSEPVAPLAASEIILPLPEPVPPLVVSDIVLPAIEATASPVASNIVLPPADLAALSVASDIVLPSVEPVAPAVSNIVLPLVDTGEIPLAVLAEVQAGVIDASWIAVAAAAPSDAIYVPPVVSVAQVEPELAPAARPIQVASVQVASAEVIPSVQLAAATQPTEALEQEQDQNPQELLQFDGMRVPRWIVETILKASDVTGVDAVYMMALADKESSFIPANKATTSSAQGLFQFISSTWLEVVKSFGAKHGLAQEAAAIKRKGGQLSVADDATRDHILSLRQNPYLSALMAAEMMKRDRAKVEQRLGRQITRSEFYLSHFFGVDSASKFMALLDGKPKQSAPRVFPKAARANKTLFFAKKGRKTRQLSVAEVYSKIDGMIDKRLDRYEGVMTVMADAR